MTPIAAAAVDTWNGFLDLVYPPRCLVCGAFGPESLCADCRAGFRPIPKPLCEHCGAPRQQGEQCRDCRFSPSEWIAQARAAGVFDGPLREAVHALKYRSKRRLAPHLGRYLSDCLLERPFGPARFDIIVPVPLHASRLRDREFNQAALIALEVACDLGLPLAERVLARRRPTKTQMELPASLRRANVRGAFAVTDADEVKDRTILLVDDVVTTLGTCDECARALLESGARAVYVASVARDL